MAERPGGSDNLRRHSTWLARYVGILLEAEETLAPSKELRQRGGKKSSTSSPMVTSFSTTDGKAVPSSITVSSKPSRRKTKSSDVSHSSHVQVDRSSALEGKTSDCLACSQDHSLVSCSAWKKMSCNDRWNFARRHGLCFRCLKSGHRGMACGRPTVCTKDNCIKSHHPDLHFVAMEKSARDSSSTSSSPDTSVSCGFCGKAQPASPVP